MKVFFSLFCALAFCFTASAQLRRIPNVADTAVNGETIYLTIPTSGYSAVTTIELDAIKISGTVAGTATLQGTLGGSIWVTLNTDTLTDATQAKVWALGVGNYQTYRIKYTTTGTQRSLPSAWALFRNP